MLSKRLYAALAAAGLLAGVGTAAASPAHSAHSARTVAAQAATTAFTNGSFETPTAPSNLFSTYFAGQTMGLWQVESGSVDLVDDGFWQAGEGEQSVDLNGGTAGTLSQTFTTEPGTKYTVTYSLAGNPAGAPTVKTGEVRIDGQNFQDFTFNTAGKTYANMGYVTRQFTFVANRPSTKLTFASTSGPTAYGPVIDDVKVKGCSCCSNSSCS
ncbi:choice-of-anchor C family protein [Streptomyces sp. TRM49041]|uniref:choice-of-anchor C family protein n=1 Tax=Streptomyces sp. TRM49041 TaxID=2603216 RepID=UPI0011EC5F46|nr:choice-of-anchor C family protein [Streptomyces sp. TRM49041]